MVNPADFYEAFSIEVNILKHLLFKDADEIVAEVLRILFSLLYYNFATFVLILR